MGRASGLGSLDRMQFEMKEGKQHTQIDPPSPMAMTTFLPSLALPVSSTRPDFFDAALISSSIWTG